MSNAALCEGASISTDAWLSAKKKALLLPRPYAI
jgi:hypothetical protein